MLHGIASLLGGGLARCPSICPGCSLSAGQDTSGGKVPQISQHEPALLLHNAINLQPCTICDLCSAGYSPSASAAANVDSRDDKQ